MEELTCRTCGEVLMGQYRLLKHRKEKHPETIKSWSHKTPKADKPVNGLDALNNVYSQIKSALELAESEREALHQRIIEYDNTIARYKDLLVRNGR